MTARLWSLTWRYAGEAGTVQGVDVEWSESVAIDRSTNNTRTARVRFVIPLDVMALTTRGHHPRFASASLSFDGRTMISGPWRDVEIEPPMDGSTMVSILIAQNDDDDQGLFPSLSKWRPYRDPREVVGWSDTARLANAVERRELGFGPLKRNVLDVEVYVHDPILRKDKWPDIAEPAEGAGWPLPIGRPGYGSELPAVPAYCVVDSPGVPSGREILIAGAAIGCSTVTVFGPNAAGATTLTSDTGVTVRSAIDDEGFAYSYVLASDLSNVNGDPGNEFYWCAEDTSASARGAGDVLFTILLESTLLIDFAAFARLRSFLNRYSLDGYVDRPTPPMELIRDQILPLLPISIVPGPSGLRPIVWPFFEDRTARGPHVIDGAGVASTGAITFLRSDDVGFVALRYGVRADDGRATRRVTASQRTSLLARFAPAGGIQETDAPLVWDPATAGQIVEDALAIAAWSPRVISLNVTEWQTYGPGGDVDLEPGARIVFSSERLGLDRAPAVVGEREWSSSEALIRLWLLDDPLTATS